MEKSVFYLGVEGGGTKSTAILCDANDKVIAQRTGKALSYQVLGQKQAKENLAALLQPFLKKTYKGKLYAVFGFAGLNSKAEKIIYTSIAKDVLPRTATFDAVNDAEISLEAECPNEKNRILVISGTGASVFGQSGSKKTKAIGWDLVFGDEGSGYTIGLKTLKAAIQSFDGRGKKTVLEKLVLKKIGATRMDEATAKAHKTIEKNKYVMKSYIASFAPLVDIALAKNDPVAISIREDTIQELVQGVDAVAQRLAIQNKDFCLGFTGSVWKLPGLKSKFKSTLQKKYPKIRFSTENTSSGVWGAVLLAKKLNQ